MGPVRGIFFDEDDARAALVKLQADGYDATLSRERLAGEDDDADHPWAVTTDAPELVLELLVDACDGWLDTDHREDGPTAPPLDLPTGPLRVKRPPQ
jgi:hypothetical protein